jgi:hypothetical protein
VGEPAVGELGHAGSCRQGAHRFKGTVGVALSTRSINLIVTTTRPIGCIPAGKEGRSQQRKERLRRG